MALHHVLLVTDKLLRPHRTGIDKYYDQLLYWLPRLAPEMRFTVVSFGEPSQPALRQATPNLEHVGLSMSRREIFVRGFVRRHDALSDLVAQADLVHCMTVLPVFTAKPSITTIFDMTPVLMPGLYPVWSRLTFWWTIRQQRQHRQHFITISRRTGSDLTRLMKVCNDQVHPIHLGVEDRFREDHHPEVVSQVRAKYRLPERYFLCIGSMHKRKNLPTILSAYRRFAAVHGTDIRLVIAGRMDLGGDDLEKHLAGDAEGVLLPGYIDAEDLPVVLAGAVALLYPSLYEGFGLPPLEAMKCATPVIVAATEVSVEVVGDCGLMCDPFDVDGFAQAMAHISTDEALRQRLIAKGLEKAAQFSWQTTAARTLDTYREIIGERNGARGIRP